ncbi:helix-turn-helix transcriptional regulator [Parageobacillus thermoglucosidasius]|uniref:helix-turn-helix transcriptional regulator n=1 Tax=Parageobacillus thermoglucosidasius TaxID=1426 RepID=UPI00055080A4|nr:helix-turn-helix transcriptional regulator [Parageobacillus thermoglucosidasius]
MRTWLKELREKKGMTQSQVAENCEISRSYYTHIENGTKTPTVKVAKKIASVLDFSWTIFFKDECFFKEQNETASA